MLPLPSDYNIRCMNKSYTWFDALQYFFRVRFFLEPDISFSSLQIHSPKCEAEAEAEANSKTNIHKFSMHK